ncbi:hypothetical protein X805_24320 [Sphaerotilus natans subsp. natans DSM 6575]|uniref:DNA 3'-5' helicase II n=1 Tax=Sphaerotilus natans subsp. natans DSM 6575 TaxID=1286631 RepID=A0A059KL78_9BURK|nr:ATP-dependent helicase [Sphaerotilus natans]KDB51954.1 hypothetical protein X805_24320 [Sphaerotilus natans subsp. natans DSM 6575]SIR00102.1 ATP-dependent DNA helicase RecQ [Sphaerotilus natans]
MSAAPRSPAPLAPDDAEDAAAARDRIAQAEQALRALLDPGDAVLTAALHEPAHALLQALQQLRDQDLLPGSATHRALQQRLLGPLTPVQRTLVSAPDHGHQLVLAGPGSGKTRVIAHRIAWLLQARQVPARQIVALAFNRGAAAELRQRLHALAGEPARGVTVLTHHAMALRLIGRPLADSEHEGVPIDFARMLDEAVALLQAEPERPRPTHLFVDEYQDMSPAQYALVGALAGPRTQLMAVGDDDQTIYGFGGASIEFIRRFCDDYAPVRTTLLLENFRSTAPILAVAERLIAPVTERMKGADAPVRRAASRQDEPPGAPVRLIDAPADAGLQAARVLDEVRRLLAEDAALRPGEIAVLARTRRSLAAVQALCLLEGLRCEVAPRPQATHRLTVLHTREGRRLLDLLERPGVAHRRAAAPMRWAGLQARHRPSHPIWQDLLLLATELAQVAPARARPAELIEQLHTLAREPRRAASPQALRLMTAHAAKGLEFRHVIVMDGDDWLAGDDERRLLYVAATRAVETLVLMRARPSRHGLMDDIGLEALQETGGLALLAELRPATPPGTASAHRRMLPVSPADIDLGHAGRMPPGHVLHTRLARLEAGDPVRLIGRRIENARGEWVGQLSRRAGGLEQRARAPGLPGRVTAILVRQRAQASEAFRADLHCERWEVPLIEVVVDTPD